MFTPDDARSWTDIEFDVALGIIKEEENRRRTLRESENLINNVNTNYLGATGVAPGDPWRQPTGAHDAYPKDWTSTHSDKLWVSLISGNVWEPGVSGWREVVEEGGEGPAPWVQPTGAHDAYNMGDVVLYEEQVWTSTTDNNVWTPGVYGWELT